LETGVPDQLIEEATGRPLRLSPADLLARGGAGAVYAHPHDASACIKLYLNGAQAAAHDAKVRAMLARPPANVRTGNGVLQIAWPQEIILRDGCFAGFVMSRLYAGIWTFDKLDSPLARSQHGVTENLRFRLITLLNLAKVLRSLHDKNHFVIDLQPKNICAYPWSAGASSVNSGYVALIDCDGFSISADGGERYHADLVMEDYYSPLALDTETCVPKARLLIGQERQQDLWAFALNAFRMLNNGLRPWDAIAGGHVGDAPDGKFRRIQVLSRTYAYGATGHRDYSPRPTNRLAGADPALLGLFERTFRSAASPPGLPEWIDVLEKLLGARNRCEASADHWKLGEECGECQARARVVVGPRRQLPATPPGQRIAPLPSVATPLVTSARPTVSHQPAMASRNGLAAFVRTYWWILPAGAGALFAATFNDRASGGASSEPGGPASGAATEAATQAIPQPQPSIEVLPLKWEEPKPLNWKMHLLYLDQPDSYWEYGEGGMELYNRSSLLIAEGTDRILLCTYSGPGYDRMEMYWHGKRSRHADPALLRTIAPDHPFLMLRAPLEHCPKLWDGGEPGFDWPTAVAEGKRKRGTAGNPR
jgi:hypothetical protein